MLLNWPGWLRFCMTGVLCVGWNVNVLHRRGCGSVCVIFRQLHLKIFRSPTKRGWGSGPSSREGRGRGGLSRGPSLFIIIFFSPGGDVMGKSKSGGAGVWFGMSPQALIWGAWGLSEHLFWDVAADFIVRDQHARRGRRDPRGSGRREGGFGRSHGGRGRPGPRPAHAHAHAGWLY